MSIVQEKMYMMNYLAEEKKRTISSRFHLSIYILSRTIHFK